MQEAIILAGGFGTRLREAVPDLPKPLAPIQGVPFLSILLRQLAEQGVQHVVLSVGYKAEMIRAAMGTYHAGISLSYVVEDEPLGTGGGIRLALEAVEGDHALVLNGDTYLTLNLSRMEALWHDHRQPVMVGREVPDTARYGRLRTLQREGQEYVIGFLEKGASGPGLINAGAYLLPRDLLAAFPAGKAFSFEQDYLAHAVMESPMLLARAEGLFIDIGVPEDYARAQSLLPLP
jgi:D-glycero-alpha-D-manno-heptose 1-phosphate guanylyltransferase